LRSAASGKIDGDIFRFPQTVVDFPNLLQIPFIIHSNGLWLYVSSKQECFDLDQLSKKIPVGVIGIHYFQKIYAISENSYEQVETPLQAIRMLDNNRADYTVANERVKTALTKETGINLTRCFDEPFISDPAYTYIHSSNADILEKLTKSYQLIFNTAK